MPDSSQCEKKENKPGHVGKSTGNVTSEWAKSIKIWENDQWWEMMLHDPYLDNIVPFQIHETLLSSEAYYWTENWWGKFWTCKLSLIDIE